jgi:hypothetical protein
MKGKVNKVILPTIGTLITVEILDKIIEYNNKLDIA